MPAHHRSPESAARSLANLVPPIKKGERRNPTGKNQWTYVKLFREFFDDIAPELLEKMRSAKGKGPKAKAQARKNAKDPQVIAIKSRFLLVLEALLDNALQGNVIAQKAIVDHMKGKATQTIEVTGADGAPLAGPQVSVHLPSNGREVDVNATTTPLPDANAVAVATAVDRALAGDTEAELDE